MSATKPLAGVRVVDMTVVWAGTYATLLLADLGAEVIKVENPFVWQPMTRGGIARPPQAMMQGNLAWATGYPENEPGPRPWNYCPTFVQLYRNKRSMTVDIRKPEGMEALRRLIAVSDVFVENNAAGALDKLGVTSEWLHAARPDLIEVRMPAFAVDGPYADARILGAHLEGIMGHTLLRSYRDLDPSHTAPIFSGDYMAGAHAATAIMMALRHRRRTGEAQRVEIALSEAGPPQLAQAFMNYAINGAVEEPLGDRSIYGHVPYNVYPCASPGTGEDGGDRWISIACLRDGHWEALRGVMGDPDWARDAAFATREGRLAAQDAIDAAIAAWTADEDDYDLFQRLQAAGVPAAPVLEASRVLADPYVQHRGLDQEMLLPDGLGPYAFHTPYYRFPETPCGLDRAPVALGQDNAYVYREVLGYSDAEIAAFEAAGHITEDFDPSIP